MVKGSSTAASTYQPGLKPLMQQTMRLGSSWSGTIAAASCLLQHSGLCPPPSCLGTLPLSSASPPRPHPTTPLLPGPAQVVDAGAVPLLVLCAQEPELAVKRIAASALGDVAKHTPELAQSVVDAGAVAYLAPLVTNQDAKLKRNVSMGWWWWSGGAAAVPAGVRLRKSGCLQLLAVALPRL